MARRAAAKGRRRGAPRTGPTVAAQVTRSTPTIATNTIAAAGPLRCHMTGIYSCAGLAGLASGDGVERPRPARPGAARRCLSASGRSAARGRGRRARWRRAAGRPRPWTARRRPAPRVEEAAAGVARDAGGDGVDVVRPAPAGLARARRRSWGPAARRRRAARSCRRCRPGRPAASPSPGRAGRAAPERHRRVDCLHDRRRRRAPARSRCSRRPGRRLSAAPAHRRSRSCRPACRGRRWCPAVATDMPFTNGHRGAERERAGLAAVGVGGLAAAGAVGGVPDVHPARRVGEHEVAGALGALGDHLHAGGDRRLRRRCPAARCRRVGGYAGGPSRGPRARRSRGWRAARAGGAWRDLRSEQKRSGRSEPTPSGYVPDGVGCGVRAQRSGLNGSVPGTSCRPEMPEFGWA